MCFRGALGCTELLRVFVNYLAKGGGSLFQGGSGKRKRVRPLPPVKAKPPSLGMFLSAAEGLPLFVSFSTRSCSHDDIFG